MASIQSKVLFITTSPRTPAKMIPEIALLYKNFQGQEWNKSTQIEFMELLREENFFNGEGANDPAFSARDRINRAPQSLGFVTLKPHIDLTPAGKELITSKRTEEVFLRQLLKFQIPSPYHKPTEQAGKFWVKPYLEIFRLIRDFGSLSFDELKLFALQLLDYNDYDIIVKKIEDFRKGKALHTGSYKAYLYDVTAREILDIYQEEIQRGDIKTREANEKSINKFVNTKAQNLRDYADACFRYLRASGVVAISKSGKSISIIPEKMKEVDYFLATISRDPIHVDNMGRYVDYLGNAELPHLYTDNRDSLIETIQQQFPDVKIDNSWSVLRLKETLADCIENKKESIIEKQIVEIKDKKLYEDIDDVFTQISSNSIYDASLMLEWNTWRAMTMIDGGDIKANLKFDDFGLPMATAQGNMADIVCEYDDFRTIVEVTLSTGQRQYEMEGEPVARHLAKIKKTDFKDSYCLFVAPYINPACLTQFYFLHKIPIEYYGGVSHIIPLELSVFRKMLDDSYKATYTPSSQQLHKFFKEASKLASVAPNETVWYNGVKELAINWLA